MYHLDDEEVTGVAAPDPYPDDPAVVSTAGGEVYLFGGTLGSRQDTHPVAGIHRLETGYGQPNGTSCDRDGKCSSGHCVGGVCCETACDQPATECVEPTCSEGSCSYEPKPQGADCDDGNSCTHDDSCTTDGTCQGTAYSCEPGPCRKTATCNGDGTCSVTTRPNGADCDDGNACTENDSCSAGRCVGDPVADCSSGDGRDAGTDATGDAADNAADAAEVGGAASSPSGCGCRTSSSGRPGVPLGVLLVGGAALLVGRRRRTSGRSGGR